MPNWVQFIIGIAAFFGAITLLWTGVFRPLIRIGVEYDQMQEKIKGLEDRVDQLEQKER